MMVEVFQTDVSTPTQATKALMLLRPHFPCARLTIDLEDCDRVLRIEAEHVSISLVVSVLAEGGIHSQVLSD